MPPKNKKADPRQELLRSFGARLKRYRQAAGLTQAALAERLELSIAYVSLLERGGRNPPWTTVVAIARGLEIPVAQLVE